MCGRTRTRTREGGVASYSKKGWETSKKALANPLRTSVSICSPTLISRHLPRLPEVEMSGASDGREKREADELRDHVAQLKAELERAKAEVKEIHRDKVKEVKSTRDAEQAQSREQLEGLRSKLQREKAEELQVK